MSASYTLGRNIKALLAKRHLQQQDLATWCHVTPAWISKILSDPKPGEPENRISMKHLDRIAEFFGFSVYQLFLPGISDLTERRSGKERRGEMDRRVSGGRPPAVKPLPSVTGEDAEILDDLHHLALSQFGGGQCYFSLGRMNARIAFRRARRYLS